MTDGNAVRLPVSPYAAELQYGDSSLRFPGNLETQFRALHLERVRLRVRVWTVALLILGCVVAVRDVLSIAAPGRDIAAIVRVALLAPTCAALLWAAWSNTYERRYLSVALLGYCCLAVLAPWVVASEIAAGRSESLAFLALFSIGVFFLAGLLFFDACLVAILGIFTFALSGVILGLALETMAYHTVVFGLIAGLCAFAAWGIEATHRRYFLERGMLGELAERDGLTGLRNRRSFDDHLTRVWQQALRDRSTIAVLLIDIDYFKNYNDAYGHQAGDACLTQVSLLVQRFARRPLDLAARYGGEELALVLYQVSAEQAQTIAEQLRAAVQGLRVEHRGSPSRGFLTVSIGVAWVEAGFDRTPDSLVEVADEALYAAKLCGRNQVKYFGPEHNRSVNTPLRRSPVSGRF
ncbi:MAG: GGDEF domain-containing protein [Steroidobacteraceae bacterium]|nr:GGDEF domain-containing protein [Steroidobacteraceae bacterium]